MKKTVAVARLQYIKFCTQNLPQQINVFGCINYNLSPHHSYLYLYYRNKIICTMISDHDIVAIFKYFSYNVV